MKKDLSLKFFTGTFFLFSVLDLIGLALDISSLRLVSKPMLMISLLLLYYVESEVKDRWYMGALFCSLMGDIFLLEQLNLFLFGVGAFLIAQLLYVRVFIKGLPNHDRSSVVKSVIPFSVYLVGLMILIGPSLGALFLPVLIYGIAISLFGAVSLLNHLLRRNSNSMTLLTGALLFIASDSMIALDKFHQPRSFYPLAIMITYIAAQYLIYRYVIRTESAATDPDDHTAAE